MKFLSTLILLLLSSIAIGQNDVDTLLNVWQDEANPPAKRASAFRQYIGNKYYRPNPDSALILYDTLIAFATKNALINEKQLALYMKGMTHRIHGKSKDGIRFAEEALELAIQMNDSIKQGNSFHELGLMYGAIGDNVKAIKFYKKSIAIQRSARNPHGMAQSYNGIGNVYLSLKDHHQAVYYVKKCVDIYDSIGDQSAYAHFGRGLGSLYGQFEQHDKTLEILNKCLIIDKKEENTRWVVVDLLILANTYIRLEDFNMADEFARKALKMATENNLKSSISQSYFFISQIYDKKKEYVKAIEYCKKTMVARSSGHGKNPAFASYLYFLGQLYIKIEDYPKAVKSCEEGYKIAVENSNLSSQSGNCQCLVSAYKSLNNTNKALYYFELQTSIKDSLKQMEATRELQKMEHENDVYRDSIETYQIELKHQQAILKKNNTRDLAIAGGILALLLAGGFYTRWLYTKRSKAVIEVEKDRSENLLLNILPQEIADELKEKGKADAREYDLVSILFSDFKGFTKASEKMNPAELVHNINHCFEAFDGIMGKHGVEKIKTIGDAYMAAGGLPVAMDNSVKNTVLAAIEMQEFIVNLQKEKEAKGEHAFEMRVGIHSGPIVAGIVGVKKFQYDIWGDTVNTASRMESHGEVGKVNISQTTFELIKDDPKFSFEHRGKVEAKGKGEIDMYFVSVK